jgi:hypothetical protein
VAGPTSKSTTQEEEVESILMLNPLSQMGIREDEDLDVRFDD